MTSVPLLDLRSRPARAAPPQGQRGTRDRIESNKLAKRLRREVGRAIQDYHMISEGDRVMVSLSGG